MASVFLSYDRDDTSRARPLAAALEKAGHSVWWDLHVRGGAQFSKVIEEALKAADVVVVLWSVESVESPWVRDEAAAGRDTGRLIPARIDATEPPLGFRQFQTIDLSDWRGRGNSRQLKVLLADIETIAGTRGSDGERPGRQAAPNPIVQTDESRTLGSAKAKMLTAGALVTLVLAGVAYWFLGPGRSGTPTIAVVAADSSPLSQGMARDALATLGSMHGMSRSDFRLLDDQSDGTVDIKINVSGSQSGDQVKSNIAIVSPSQKSVLWSKQVTLPSNLLVNAGRAVAYAAARALSCAMDDLSGTYGRLSAEQLHVYLNACASAPDRDDPQTVIPIFRQITAQAPKFAPAWSQLLLSEMDSLSRSDPATAARLRTTIQQDIPFARRADAHLVEADLAEIELLPKDAFLRALQLADKAKSEHPDDALVLAERADLLSRVGRGMEAVDELQRAIEFQPFASALREQYILNLAYAGGIAKARDELTQAKQLWPDAPAVERAEQGIELRFGDAEKALRSRGPVDGPILLYANARKNPTDENIDAFVNLARGRELNAAQRSFVYQAFPELHRSNVLYDYLDRWPIEQDMLGATYILFRPWMRDFRRDPRFMRVAQRVGLLDYWEKSGHWPDFCEEADQPYDCKKEAAKLTA